MAALGTSHLAPSPTVKHSGQKSGRELCVKFSNYDRFCSQNLQTMSANCFSFWGTSLDLLAGLCPWPHWEIFVLGPLGYSPQMKIPGVIIVLYALGPSVCLSFTYVLLTEKMKRCVENSPNLLQMFHKACKWWWRFWSSQNAKTSDITAISDTNG